MKILLAIIASLLIFGCGESKSTKSDHKSPGKISLQLAPLKAAKVSASDSVEIESDSTDTLEAEGVDIELGTIRSSKAFFFIIRNVGGSPITNLRVTSNTESVTMTPGFIPVLETDGSSTITQIAELDVIHGTDIGTRKNVYPLLPYGRSTTTLYFDGETDGEEFHEEFEIGYQAIYVNLTPINDTDAVAGPEMAFAEDTCELYVIDQYIEGVEHHISANDTVKGASSQVADNFNYLIFAKTDCVIRNQLPKELQ